jgi:hypothetical protein
MYRGIVLPRMQNIALWRYWKQCIDSAPYEMDMIFKNENPLSKI